MHTFTLRLLSLLAAILVLLIVAVVPVAKTEAPFKGNYEGSIILTNGLPTALIATGIASHLGKSKFNATLTILGPATGCKDGFVLKNQITLTAANGDQLKITIEEEEICPTSSPGIFETTDGGNYVVSGGTGRFAGAVGQGTYRGIGDFNTAQFQCNLTGTIND